MSSGGKAQFSNPNCKKDCTKRVMEKIDFEYDDITASDYDQCHKAACLGYMNPQCLAKY
jgi:hypothetical protein